jgi:hypothetical protein
MRMGSSNLGFVPIADDRLNLKRIELTVHVNNARPSTL